MPNASLCERLGGALAVAAVIDLFSDAVVRDPIDYAATKPGSTPLGLEEAHRQLKISPAEFDAVAAELSRSLDDSKVPEPEKGEVLAAFAAHKSEVNAGYTG